MPTSNRWNSGAMGRLSRIVSKDNAAVGLLIDTRYEVHRRIARGGMGEIFYALDKRLDRPVAMKILTRGLSEERWRTRFEVEARTMGRLEHPGVVPIFDIGSLPDGRMYYTMKYVPGRTLEEMIGEGPAHDRLLEVLRKTCEVVQHAHERGVIHRDLKPANIMVGEKGQVYVLDWGIARLMQDWAREAGEGGVVRPGQTLSGTILGTIEYMPPEQAAGQVEKIDERSDVYSLGAILYEILTGRPPVTGVSATQLLEQVVRGTVVPPRDRNPAIPVDLDAICRKAMHVDPHHRYPSVAALSQDLLRYQEGHAVAARPVGWGSRLRLAVRRRPGVALLGAAAVLLFILLPLIVIPLQQNVSEETERNQAQREALVLLERARVSIDRAERYRYDRSTEYEELVRRVEEGQSLIEEAVGRVPELALGQYLLGRAWEIRGDLDQAEDRYRRAVAYDVGFGPAHYQLSRLLVVRGVLIGADRSPELREVRDDEIRRIFAEAAGEAERSLAKGSGFDDELQREIASAVLQQSRGELKEALEALRGGIERFSGRPGVEDLHWILGLYETDENRRRTEFDRAIELCPRHWPALYARGAQHLRGYENEEAIRDFNEVLTVSPRFTDAYFLRAIAFMEMGRYDEAIADCGEVLRLRPGDKTAYHKRGSAWVGKRDLDRAAADFEEAIRIDPSYAPGYNNRGSVRRMRGDEAGALKDFEEAIRLRPGYAPAHTNRGLVREAQGDRAGALEDYNRALELQPESWVALTNRGGLYSDDGRQEEAIRDFDRALQINPHAFQTLFKRGMAFHRRDDLDRAIRDYSAALQKSPSFTQAWCNRALAHRDRGDLDLAKEDFDRALETDPTFVLAWVERGNLHFQRRENDEALRDYDEALRLDPRNVNAYNNRGRVHVTLRDLESALADFEQAAHLDPSSLAARMNYGRALCQLGRLEEGERELEAACKLVPEENPTRTRLEQWIREVRQRRSEEEQNRPVPREE